MKKILISFLVIVLIVVAFFLGRSSSEKTLPADECQSAITTTATTLDLLQGKWVAIDDENSVIEFNGDKKIDYYSGEKMSEGTVEINDETKHLSVDEQSQVLEYTIIDLSDQRLVLMYLGRGNILEYTKVVD